MAFQNISPNEIVQKLRAKITNEDKQQQQQTKADQNTNQNRKKIIKTFIFLLQIQCTRVQNDKQNTNQTFTNITINQSTFCYTDILHPSTNQNKVAFKNINLQK